MLILIKAHHLQCTPDNTTDDVRVEQVWVVVRQLNKVRERVLVQNEGEFISFLVPVCNSWNNPQECLESNLRSKMD